MKTHPFSYMSPAASSQLADYLAQRLSRPSTAKAKLKTLKSTDAVARRGSRNFRKVLFVIKEQGFTLSRLLYTLAAFPY
jgi:hypothetical protein